MWTTRWISAANDVRFDDIVLRLTAIDLLLRPMGPWSVRPFILALAGLALILPKVLRAPATWYALAGLVAVRIVAEWPLPDNHIYLLAYWCLAVALALGAADGQRILSLSSRRLIGLTFLMAVLWKGALSPDYLDRRFFRVTLLTDERFTPAAIFLGGLTESQLVDNRSYLVPLPEGAELLDPPELVEPRAFRRLVAALTWGGLVGEALVAVFWLLPLPGRAAAVRHILLLTFCVVTYALAPVAGFGWLLLAMGLASCTPEQRFLRGAYIAGWFLVLLYSEVPWLAMLF